VAAPESPADCGALATAAAAVARRRAVRSRRRRLRGIRPLPLNALQQQSAAQSGIIERLFSTSEGACHNGPITRFRRPGRNSKVDAVAETVNRSSAVRPPGRSASALFLAKYPDVVVALGGIPLDVVFLGLDWASLGGVHSAGRPGPESDPDGAEEAAERRPRRQQKAQGWRKIATALAAISHDHSDRQIEPGSRPNRDATAGPPGRGRKAGDRRDVGRAAVARSRGDPPPEYFRMFRDVRRRMVPPHRIAAPRQTEEIDDKPGRSRRGAGNESSRREYVPRERQD
jgi:hypothetical protein